MNKIIAATGNLLLLTAAVVMLLSVSACGKKPPEIVTRLSISTTPEKATVTIRGKEIGETPVKLKVKPGIYLVKLSLPGYKNRWQKIEIKLGDQQNLTFPRFPKSLVSAPSAAGASVTPQERIYQAYRMGCDARSDRKSVV